MEHPVYVESFTIPQAAKALGRSELAFKRWITDGLVPPPLLKDTSRGYKHYSVGELAVIARVLKEHEAEFQYYASSHVRTIQIMWQSMQGHRALHI